MNIKFPAVINADYSAKYENVIVTLAVTLFPLFYLVSQGHYNVYYLLALAVIGNTLGAMTTWWLGVLAAKKYPVAGLLSEKKQKALVVVKDKGIWILFFSWLPVVGDAFCFAGGWLKLPIIPACLLILTGKLSRYAVIAWAFL